MMTLHTRIPIGECKDRLSCAVDAERFSFSWSGFAGSRPILGSVTDSGFRLQKRRYYRNSFAPCFHGRFLPSDSGTRIEGEFRMNPFAKVFMLVWFSFLTVFIAVMLVSVIAERPDVRGGASSVLLVPVGMAAFGVALVKLGQWLGRGEERTIVAFLKTTLDAHDAA